MHIKLSPLSDEELSPRSIMHSGELDGPLARTSGLYHRRKKGRMNLAPLHVPTLQQHTIIQEQLFNEVNKLCPQSAQGIKDDPADIIMIRIRQKRAVKMLQRATRAWIERARKKADATARAKRKADKLRQRKARRQKAKKNLSKMKQGWKKMRRKTKVRRTTRLQDIDTRGLQYLEKRRRRKSKMIAEEFITLLQAKNSQNSTKGWHDLRLQDDLVKALSNIAQRQDSPSKRAVLTQLKEYTDSNISKSDDESENKYASLMILTNGENMSERPKSSPAHTGKHRQQRQQWQQNQERAAVATATTDAQANNASHVTVKHLNDGIARSGEGHVSVYLPRPCSRTKNRRPTSAKPRSRSTSPMEQEFQKGSPSGFTHKEATGDNQSAMHKRLRRSIAALPADDHMRAHRAHMRTIGGF